MKLRDLLARTDVRVAGLLLLPFVVAAIFIAAEPKMSIDGAAAVMVLCSLLLFLATFNVVHEMVRGQLPLGRHLFLTLGSGTASAFIFAAVLKVALSR